MSNNIQQRDSFGSKLGVIAAAAGSAIGLGNIWKFPYITGIYGGAAFIVVYLICIVLIGLTVMLAEFIIGRKAQKNAIGAFQQEAPGTPFFLVGWMGVAAAFCILAFYGVVAGWTLEYVFKAVTTGFSGQTPDKLGAMFGGFIGSNFRPLFWQIIFMALTCLIVIGGIKDGIEKYSKILMPFLLLILGILVLRAVTLPGSGEGVAFLLKPDFSKLSPEAVLSALGHAFFSLSLGMGTMITYGSYISKQENIGTMAIQVTIADTGIALLAGLAIFPAVFAFGIEPGAGPGLVFITLPNVFQQMPGGYLFAILFFLLLAIAALTSSISILEVVTAYFVEELKLNRKKAAVITTIAIAIVGIPCSLSMGSMSDVTFFGMTFFDLLDYLASNILLPLGGLFISIFVGWYLGFRNTNAEVTNNGELKSAYMLKIVTLNKETGEMEETFSPAYMPVFMFLAKFVAPIAISIVFLHGLGLIKF